MLLLCVSCGGPTEQENQTASKRPVKESLIDANRHLRESEDDLIEDFIRRYEWKVERTSSGLRYLIYAEGAGDAIQVGDTVRLEYELRLLNGQVVYTSGERGILEFRQGKAQVTRGLDEAVLLLHRGDQAKIIIPSHLGYGLPGDQDRIPPRASLIYDVKVL